jgi:hypothetical protein
MSNRTAAAKEILRRQGNGNRFPNWCRELGHEPQPHHEIIIRTLEACARGQKSRAMLCLPPGSSKTWYASHAFPPWLMAKSGGSILSI